MSELRVRSWERREYFDPARVLRDLRLLEHDVSRWDVTDRVRRLRTGRLKELREARDAALFAYGMSTALGCAIRLSPGETEDADFITVLVDGDTLVYTPVQLKELVPEDLNPTADLEQLVSSLAGRPHSDAVLAVRLNRRQRVEFSTLPQEHLPFAEVWYFGSMSPDANRWFLYGDVLSNATLYEFDYPV